MLGHYGIDTYVYKSKYPIDLSHLERLFEQFPNEVFRMKGRCYNPGSEELYEISQIGASIRLHTFHMPSWSSDVFSEFLFIGEELDRNDIQKKIEACLRTTVTS
nr:GTP-binding protein [Halalkalibacter oceani]